MNRKGLPRTFGRPSDFGLPSQKRDALRSHLRSSQANETEDMPSHRPKGEPIDVRQREQQAPRVRA